MVTLIEYGLGYQSRNMVQPDDFNHNNLNPNSNPKTDPNPNSKNNVCTAVEKDTDIKFIIVLYI